MVSSVRTLVRTFSSATRRRLFVAVLGSLVLAVAEIVGILAVLPLMQLLTGTPPDTSAPLRALAGLTGSTDPSVLIVAAAALMFAIFLFKGVAALCFRWWILGFIYREESETSQELLAYYVRAPYWLHLQRNSADMLRTMNESVSLVFSNVVVGGLTVLSEAATILLISTTLFIVMPIPTLGFALYFGLASYGFIRLMRTRSFTYGRAMNNASLAIYQTAAQILGGVKEIKVRNNSRHFIGQYENARESYAWAHRRVAFVNELPKYFLEIFFITALGISTVALFARAGADTALPMLALLAAAGFRILPSVARLLGSFNGLRVGLPALDLVLTDVSAAQDVEHDLSEVPTPLDVRREIVVDAVSFRYRGTAEDVLSEVSLRIPAGSSVALVGASGSGKSTLVDLLLGLHAPKEGRVTVDGSDICGHMVAWQRAIGFVSQDVYILDDTLRANVAFGEPPGHIDDKRLHSALSRAQLTSFIRELPDGLDTFVGERGARLSGGQRQRIGIARALYLEPKVLILDEATSALDSKTESRITSSVESLRGEVTLVVVAHRLSTVRKCDLVVFLDRGRVAATGSFEHLTAVNKDFAHLVELGRLDLSETALAAARKGL